MTIKKQLSEMTLGEINQTLDEMYLEYTQAQRAVVKWKSQITDLLQFRKLKFPLPEYQNQKT